MVVQDETKDNVFHTLFCVFFERFEIRFMLKLVFETLVAWCEMGEMFPRSPRRLFFATLESDVVNIYLARCIKYNKSCSED